MKRILSFLALLLLAASGAHAAAPISGCSPDSRKTIEALHDELGRSLQELNDPEQGVPRFTFSQIQKSVLKPERRTPSPRYTNHAATYQSFFAKMISVLGVMEQKHASGYSYACVSSWEGGCRGGAYAYVKFFFGSPTNKIYFCPSFWEMDQKDQLRTVFHELSHLAALTTDDLGNIFTSSGMISQANEAYFYDSMLNGDLEQFLKIRSWGLLWVKPRK